MGRALSLGVAIVGSGLIGRKRASALGAARLVAAADPIESRALSLAAAHPGAIAAAAWQDVVERRDVDIVSVASTNDALAPIAVGALTPGKHVFVETPGPRTFAD